MFEVLVVATATTGLFALARGVRGSRFKHRPRALTGLREVRDDDLPCPWCYAPTEESDERCRNCGRFFR